VKQLGCRGQKPRWANLVRPCRRQSSARSRVRPLVPVAPRILCRKDHRLFRSV